MADGSLWAKIPPSVFCPASAPPAVSATTPAPASTTVVVEPVLLTRLEKDSEFCLVKHVYGVTNSYDTRASPPFDFESRDMYVLDTTFHKCLMRCCIMDVGAFIWLQIPSRHPALCATIIFPFVLLSVCLFTNVTCTVQLRNHLHDKIRDDYIRQGHLDHAKTTSIKLIDSFTALQAYRQSVQLVPLSTTTTYDLEKANYDIVLNGIMERPDSFIREFFWCFLLYLPRKPTNPRTIFTCETCNVCPSDHHLAGWEHATATDLPLSSMIQGATDAFLSSQKAVGGQFGACVTREEPYDKDLTVCTYEDEDDDDDCFFGYPFEIARRPWVECAQEHLDLHTRQYRSYFADHRPPRKLSNITATKQRAFAMRGIQRAILVLTSLVNMESWFINPSYAKIPAPTWLRQTDSDPHHLFYISVANCLSYVASWDLCYASSLPPFSLPPIPV